MNSDPTRLLRDKATLLIRREREIYELRHERGRTEAWLDAFYRLTSYLQSKDAATILSDWACTLTGDLGFQVAAVYACNEDMSRLHLLHYKAHCALETELDMDEEAAQFLRITPSGCFMTEEPSDLRGFSKASGLQSFFWLSLFGRGSRLLLLTGYSRVAGRFHSLSEHDLGHFVLFGNHIAALLDNLTLIDALENEKRELHRANDELDQRLKELNEAQNKLLSSSKKMAEVSRRAGMADIATGVLHNVGNALNSVNVSGELVVDRVQKMKLGGIAKTAELLATYEQEPENDAPARTQKAAQYLKLLAQHLEADRNSILAEVQTLQQNVDHIKSIVSKQQIYTKSVGVIAPCDPAELMNDALRLVEVSLGNEKIEVVRLYDEVPPILLDQHKVVQILVNLLSNAKHALIGSQQTHPCITLRVCQGCSKTSHPPATSQHPSRSPVPPVHMIIEDNGIGIASENMPNIFAYGFTTREAGHGFGLHTSALTAQDLGGRLKCLSEGYEQGARFILELPAISSEHAISPKTISQETTSENSQSFPVPQDVAPPPPERGNGAA